MGGSIGITIRKEDGTVHNMIRHTNLLPHFLENMKFINCDEDHLDKYIKNETEDDDNFPHVLAPTGYGLTLIDYQTKTILSDQGYCSMPDQFDLVKLILPIEDKRKLKKGIVDLSSGMGEGTYEPIKEFWDSGRIKGYLFNDKKKKSWFEEDIDCSEFENYNYFLADVCKKYDNRRGNKFYYKIIVDISPWKVIYFEESEEGFIKMRSKMYELGFNFNQKDEERWKEYFDEQEYNYSNLISTLRKHKIESI